MAEFVIKAKGKYQPKQLLLTMVWNKFEKSPSIGKPSLHTLNTYKYWITQFIDWLDKNHRNIKVLSAVDSDIAKKYATHIYDSGISHKTYNEILNTLARVFNIFHDEAGITSNPFSKKDIPRLAKNTVSRKEFTREETTAILNSFKEIDIPFKTEYELLFYLAVFSGFRQKDGVLLQWNDINFNKNQIFITPYKTKKHDIKVQIPIHPSLRQKLLEAFNIRINNDVIPNLASIFRINPKPVEKVIKKILEYGGFKNPELDKSIHGQKLQRPCLYGMHSFRYSFVSFCAESGVPMAIVSDIVGHSNVAMTRHYARVSNESKQKAISSVQLLSDSSNSTFALRDKIISKINILPEDKLAKVSEYLESLKL